jgi:hypothetical protein
MPAQQEGMHLGFPLTIHNNTAVSRQAFIENDIPSTDTFLTARNLISGTSVAFGVGSGHINHGVWSDTLNRWMIYSQGSDVFVNNYFKVRKDGVSEITPANGVSYIQGCAGYGTGLYVKKGTTSDSWKPALTVQTKGQGGWSIGNYDDESLDGASVDELFLGQIDYAGLTEEQGLYIVPDENFDLAYAEADIDDKAYVSPCDIRVAVGNDEFAGKFYCMQYVYQEVQSGQWHVYNNDVIRFYDDYGVMKPLTMTRKSTSTDKPASIMKRSGKVSVPEEEEKPLRAKVYQPRSERKAKGVVRAK